MDAVLKKGLGLVVIVFVIWFMFTNPAGLADLLKETTTWVWHALTQLFNALANFFSALTS